MPMLKLADPIVLQDLFKRGRNSFSVLRLILAASVVFSHSYYLPNYGVDPFEHWTGLNLGSLAVDGFFALSGMLVTASLLRDHSLIGFIQHRLARLIPGFWACLFFCAFILAPITVAVDYGQSILFSSATIKSLSGYVIKNATLFIIQPALPNVLTGLDYRRINPCLWTLAPEAACYILLALAGALTLLRSKQRAIVLLVIFLLGLVALSGLGVRVIASLGGQPLVRLFELALHFLGGVVTVRFLGKLRLSAIVTCGFAIMYAACLFVAPLHFLRVLLLAPALAALARVIPLHGRFDAMDISYGIYLYGSALQQMLVWAGLVAVGPWSFFAVSLLITAPLALLSWLAVERPALRRWGRRRVGNDRYPHTLSGSSI